MTEAGHIPEDVLERYALGTLDDEKRREADAHAADCPLCRDALRHEAMIAAGVRMAGRADLAGSLGRRIAALDRSRRRWRMLAAAAVVAVITGSGLIVALLEGWGSGAPPPVAGARTITPGPARRDEVQTAPGLSAANAPSPPPGTSGAPHAVKSLADAERATAEHEEKPAGDQLRLPAAALPAEGEGYWSEGVIEETRGEATALQESGAARAQGAPALKKEVPELKGSVSKDALAGDRQEFRIRQEPASALPGAKQRQAGESTVPARVQERGKTTTLTLYLDTLVNERELQGASVRQAGGDTVIVELGKRKILYRLGTPQGAPQQKSP
ncbi:MAG TPA: hypothetical protein VL221_14145 [Bacteroidota bacterium]|nr:hypothetical protein [Bacteroidota bacterium]